MIASPRSSFAARSVTVFSVISPAGTITHAARGTESLATKSSRESAPTALSLARAATASGSTS